MLFFFFFGYDHFTSTEVLKSDYFFVSLYKEFYFKGIKKQKKKKKQLSDVLLFSMLSVLHGPSILAIVKIQNLWSALYSIQLLSVLRKLNFS